MIIEVNDIELRQWFDRQIIYFKEQSGVTGETKWAKGFNSGMVEGLEYAKTSVFRVLEDEEAK